MFNHFPSLISTPRNMRHWKYDEYFNTIVLLPGEDAGTFVHEAGHALGAHHDRYTTIEGWTGLTDGSLSSIDDREGYNYGYCLPGNEYATVMSYSHNCPRNADGDWIDRIMYYSNPDVSYKGVPTGNSQNNNARAIQEKRETRSQDGTNCYDGFPKPGSPMGQKLCDWTSWTGFQKWESCCCAEDYQECPTVSSHHHFSMSISKI